MLLLLLLRRRCERAVELEKKSERGARLARRNVITAVIIAAAAMHICVGAHRARLDAALPTGPTLQGRALAALRAYNAVFLEFGDGLYIPLSTEAHVRFAATMATMAHEQAAGFDDDHWIAEALAMERATEEHMIAPSSSADEGDDDDSATA